MVIQLSLYEAILDLLYLKPMFIGGLAVVAFFLFWLLRKDKGIAKFRMICGSVLLNYYLCIIFKNIVGIPNIHEFYRLTSLGESFFHPNMSFIPLVNGISLEFILNIFCFIPLGFLCPVISGTYERIKKVILLGFGLSLTIEISQIFTLYRATDINDLIANVLGTIIGYSCFQFLRRFGMIKSSYIDHDSLETGVIQRLPIFIAMFAFVITFIS